MHTYRRGINGGDDDAKESLLYTQVGFEYCMWGRQITILADERQHHFALVKGEDVADASTALMR